MKKKDKNILTFEVFAETKSVTKSRLQSKLYIPSTLNIDFILWHTQMIVCTVK